MTDRKKLSCRFTLTNPKTKEKFSVDVPEYTPGHRQAHWIVVDLIHELMNQNLIDVYSADTIGDD